MDLNALAINAAGGLTVTQLHSSACGLAGIYADGEGLCRALVEMWGSDQLDYDITLVQFSDAVIASLQSEDLEFELLIPDDNESIGERSAGLGEWCENFLTGFGLSNERRELGEDIQELISDFAAIANVDGVIEEAEEFEIAFSELYEYVRVGVILIFSSDPEED